MKLTDNKLILSEATFSSATFKNVTGKEIKRLNPAAKNFFHFIGQFAKLCNIKSKFAIQMLEDHIQETETVTCGVF